MIEMVYYDVLEDRLNIWTFSTPRDLPSHEYKTVHGDKVVYHQVLVGAL